MQDGGLESGCRLLQICNNQAYKGIVC